MQVIKVDSKNFLVEWKYKDFLRIGYSFQGATIMRLERWNHMGLDYVRVTVDGTNYKI